MKETELRQIATCAHRHRKIGETGLPLFYVLTVERYGLNLPAIQRQQGLTLLVGGSARLAAIMGPDEDMAESVMEPVKLTICEACASENICLADAIEFAAEKT